MYGLFFVMIVFVLPVRMELLVSIIRGERCDNVTSYHPAPFSKKISSVSLYALLGKPLISLTG